MASYFVLLVLTLFTCLACAELSNIVKTLKEFGLCSEVHYKEMYLEKEELEGEYLFFLSLFHINLERAVFQTATILAVPLALSSLDSPDAPAPQTYDLMLL